MKIINFFIFFLYFLLISMEKIKAQHDHSFILKISNIKNSKAKIRIAFYNSESSFLNEKEIFKGKELIPTNKGEIIIKYDDIPFGDYGIAVFQDKNGNNKLDTNFLGYPSEPFAFSNNFKPKFSAPKFKDCKITFSKINNSFSIILIN